jgi:hypothetical protein
MHKVDPRHLTIRHAQLKQPWTVPYSAGIDIAAQKLVPHILATHTVLHATKSLGKMASVFEALDHSRNVGVEGESEPMTPEHLATVKAMSADLLTAALRFANLYSFDIATVLLDRIKEKNGVELEADDAQPTV